MGIGMHSSEWMSTGELTLRIRFGRVLPLKRLWILDKETIKAAKSSFHCIMMLQRQPPAPGGTAPNVSLSVILNHFNFKDPRFDMHFATDPFNGIYISGTHISIVKSMHI